MFVDFAKHPRKHEGFTKSAFPHRIGEKEGSPINCVHVSTLVDKGDRGQLKLNHRPETAANSCSPAIWAYVIVVWMFACRMSRDVTAMSPVDWYSRVP